jgi:uncharacterized protein
MFVESSPCALPNSMPAGAKSYSGTAPFTALVFNNINYLPAIRLTTKCMLESRRYLMSELSMLQRIVLKNQYAILEKLDPENADQHRFKREVLEEGYSGLYESTLRLGDEVCSSVCDQVGCTLEMFRFLRHSYGQLKDKTGIREADIAFEGFDANDEAGHHAYAEFVIQKFDWPEFRDGPMNSHSRGTLPMYRRMLRRYRLAANQYALTKGEILNIIDARTFRG